MTNFTIVHVSRNKYQIINQINTEIGEEPRYSGTKFYLLADEEKNIPGQFDSHGIDYLEARKMYKKLGDIMGLERNFGWCDQDYDGLSKKLVILLKKHFENRLNKNQS